MKARRKARVLSSWLSPSEHDAFTAYAKRLKKKPSPLVRAIVMDAVNGRSRPEVVQDPERTFPVDPAETSPDEKLRIRLAWLREHGL